MGVRDSSFPLSYRIVDGPVGFQIDICRKVIPAIQAKLGLPNLEVKYQYVTSQNRMPLVQNGTVDIECGSTTNIRARQKEVAFAITTYMEEVRLTGEMKTWWNKWFIRPIPPHNAMLNMEPPEALQRIWAQPNDLPMEGYAR